ncbi:MAG TPA: penicillin-binding transpeptidase domain-containing protein, partial [Sedimentibacter sp.]|nr:penicillin-binding transpeptidase domain-containing protein [Sedimentibacter sp.]
MIKFFKNRFNILYMIIVLLLIILGFRMAVLTIVEGQDYRQIADIKKIKDIPVKAPRGKIFDRNGLLLADNVSSFTVQMYTDEIKAEDFNDISYKLSKIFDENMERPIDEFPIELDTFDYIDKNVEIIQSDTDQSEEIETAACQTAEEKVIERVKENIYEWLNFSIFMYGENFSPKQRVYAAIIKDEVPIQLKGENFEYNEELLEPIVNGVSIDGNELPEQKTPIQIWLSENNLRENLSAEEAAAQLLINNNKYLSSLFSNSKIRKLSYEFLKQKGLVENIKLNEFSFVQDEEYENIKRNLNASNEEITLNTSAKDDFVILTMKNSIDNLLRTVYHEPENIKPGAILIDRLKDIYPDLPVKFIEEGETGIFEYTDTETRDRYFNQQHMDYSTTAYVFVKELAFKNYDVLFNLVTDDNIKYFSQIELLKYVNPSISIAEWEYTPLRDKNAWIIKNVSTYDDEMDDYSASKVFKMLRESLEIDEEINDYELRNMMVLRERYNRISYLSYHPVDICYGISEKTVAMISERSHELNGINVEIEPLRYYPQYESASHIIGYLGKIAQDYELQEYVVEKGYSTDDIIGKTGLEEKFEDYLRGEKGRKTVEVNNVGRTIRSVSSEAPVPGDDIFVTVDLQLQKKAEESLKKGLEKIREGGVFESEWGDFHFKDKYENAYSGALVALDVKTNEVLALANYPAYDLNLFATGITMENWNSLLNDSKNPLAPRPLYNISMLTAIQPGSTFKMITSLAALEKGVNPNTTV